MRLVARLAASALPASLVLSLLPSGLAGCSFSGSNGTIDGPQEKPDGGPDAKPDSGPDGPPLRGRRIALHIPAARVSAPLVDFPVYVRLTSPDLSARLDASATQLSFTGAGSNDGVLAHEIESFNKATGELAAWVRVNIDSNAETRFELRYGDDSVKAAPDLLGVWRNGHKAVFHFEQEPINGVSTVVNSATPSNPGTPTGMESNDFATGVLGKAYDFDGANEEVAFENPILGAGPSTISFWFRDTDLTPDFDEAIVVLGTAATSQARYIFNEINTNKLPLGLQGDDWTKPTVPPLAGWALVHWVYDNQQSRLYVDGVEATDSPFAHAAAAATTGSGARIGNAPPGFPNNWGVRGSVDEVRISDVVRSPAWINAELANQKEPSMFVIAGSASDL